MTTTKIKIEKINYFGESTKSNDWNAKCLYWKYGKLYVAMIFVDFFNRRVYSAKQAKHHQILKGAICEINKFAIDTDFRLSK